ncbi:hypothetical protein BDV95DRAFT_602482 [Massariosphaeria phaeospora]|uniref:Uncharacterized protein n=1 Tax=Massariosphaeria phaeospora TaxID=100035 RepID=A0A7C8MTG3_9PLEO|nr:hypothetical protein BDV95DRAFT_602482 [Massariosphaeria phaeospora]
MAERSKKRKRRSVSPATRKSHRTASASTFRSTPGDSADVPISEKWNFRIEVVSSTNPDSDVLRKAIAGLIKICFPESFLDQLGRDVVAAHMRQEDATESQIECMRTVFQSEMLRRVSSMLATYMDTPEKFKLGIASLVRAGKESHELWLAQEDVNEIRVLLKELRKPAVQDTKE